MPRENILQTLQKYATIAHRLDEINEKLSDVRTTLTGRVDILNDQMANVRERLAHLEASRDADQAQIQAEVARFKVEVERAALRLSPPPSPESE